MVDDLGTLLAGAVAASPVDRLPTYRDRLASHGAAAVKPLLALEQSHPALGYFVVLVLSAKAMQRVPEAREAIHELARSAVAPETRTFAASHMRALLPAKVFAPSPPAVAPPRPPRAAPSPHIAVLAGINRARGRRNEPVLDEAEALKVLTNLEARATDPSRYKNVCWNCRAVVDAATNQSCGSCSWLVCWCGACRSPGFQDSRGQSGPCMREAWAFGPDVIHADHDFTGKPIYVRRPLDPDEGRIRRTLEQYGVHSVYHWSPVRSVESILSLGILSRRALQGHRISVVGHGYGSHEKEVALRGFAGVSFAPKPRMMAEWSENPVVFELTTEVLLGQGTLFVPGNSGSRSFQVPQMLSMTGADAVDGLFADGAAASQAEGWVPQGIPRVGIKQIHVASNDTLFRIAPVTKKHPAVAAVVSPSFFEDG